MQWKFFACGVTVFMWCKIVELKKSGVFPSIFSFFFLSERDNVFCFFPPPITDSGAPPGGQGRLFPTCSPRSRFVRNGLMCVDGLSPYLIEWRGLDRALVAIYPGPPTIQPLFPPPRFDSAGVPGVHPLVAVKTTQKKPLRWPPGTPPPSSF